MTSQSSQTGGKSAPLEVKVFFLVTLFSAMLIYTTNQTIIGPIIDTIDSAFSQSISQPVSQSISQSGDVRILDMKKYRETRGEKFDSWFGEGEKIIANADNNGTILDFAIVGFAKCGTTSMEANLGTIAPMPVADVCTPLAQTVYHAYKNWPREFNETNNGLNRTKILRGTKCPRQISDLNEFSKSLPKTLLIAGIRHPVLFFQSFWNMLQDNQDVKIRHKSPYDYMEHCRERDRRCVYECPRRSNICLHKSRFHLHLARTGKTLLDDTERELLAPDDKDGGFKLTNRHTKNPIFLYELSQLNEDDTWDDLAQLLKVPYIPHDFQFGNNKKRKNISEARINICDDTFDSFRSKIMPHAYNMSKWLCDYLVPVAMDETRDDVIISNPEHFCEIVKGYADDPCNRLVRADNGEYILGNTTVNSRVDQ